MALANAAVSYEYTETNEQHQQLFALIDEFHDLIESPEENHHSVSILFSVIVDYYNAHVSEELEQGMVENHCAFASNAKRIKMNIDNHRMGYKKLASMFLKNAINCHIASC